MSKHAYYGYPNVKDPNDFIPDGESSSPEEIAAHKAACAAYKKPGYKPPDQGCKVITTGDISIRKTSTAWGIGTNLIPMCDGCEELDPESLIACHECGGQEFCAVCWPKHEKEHDENRI